MGKNIIRRVIIGQRYDRKEVLKNLEDLYGPLQLLGLYGRGENGSIDAEAVKIVSKYVKKDPGFHKTLILSCLEFSKPDRGL